MRHKFQTGKRNKSSNFSNHRIGAIMVILHQVLVSSFSWLKWMAYLAGFLVEYLFSGFFRDSVRLGQPCNLVPDKFPVLRFFCPQFYCTAIG